MSKLNNLTDFLTSLANKLREKASMEGNINPQDFEKMVDFVYDNGYTVGYETLYSNVSAYINPTDYIIKFNEVRNNAYIYAFSGLFWGESQNFKLPYWGISKVTNGHGMFKYSGITSLNMDYVYGDEHTYNGIDFSQAIYPNQMFRYSSIQEMGTVVFEKAKQMSATFGDMSSLHTINYLVLPNQEVQYHLTFDNSKKLANITLCPNRIMSSISFGTNSLLTKESIQSIIEALSDSASGQTIYINTTAVNREFKDSSSTNNGSKSEEWQTLIATKPNWNIVLSTSSGLV